MDALKTYNMYIAAIPHLGAWQKPTDAPLEILPNRRPNSAGLNTPYEIIKFIMGTCLFCPAISKKK